MSSYDWGQHFFRDKSLRDGEDTYMKLREAKYSLDVQPERTADVELDDEEFWKDQYDSFHEQPRIGCFNRYDRTNQRRLDKQKNAQFVPTHKQSEERVDKVNKRMQELFSAAENGQANLRHSTAKLNASISKADALIAKEKSKGGDPMVARLYHDVTFNPKTGRKKATAIGDNMTAVDTFEKIFPPELCGHYGWHADRSVTEDEARLKSEIGNSVASFYRSSPTGRDIQAHGAPRQVGKPLCNVEGLPPVKDLDADIMTKQVIRTIQKQGEARRQMLFNRTSVSFDTKGSILGRKR